MKASINGKIYDTDAAERQAEFITYSNTSHELYRTTDGEFFLQLTDYIFDGRRLGPLEDIDGLTKEHVDPQKFSEGHVRRHILELEHRLRSETRLVPITNDEALKWCVKTQIPESLRGYLLDCL